MKLSSDDRGATALFVALVMVLIMGIAAVVIDGGLSFAEKRQAQSGADFASLAALIAATGPNPEDAGAAEAQSVVATNLPGRSLDWVGCDDPGRPAEYTIVSSLTKCVSFNENFSRARVRLPEDAVDTSFGRLLGLDSIIVGAESEATQSSKATADILPYTAGGGSIVCLFSNQAPQTVDPCDGPYDGFFGYLDVALYGSDPDDLDNPWTCANGTANTRSAINIAKGSDHIMVEWDSGDPVVNDHAECVNRSENVNELVVQPGSPTLGADGGLIDGVSGSINGQAFGSAPGRIAYNGSWSKGKATVKDKALDDTPLWAYLLDPSCPWAGAAIDGNVNEYQEMLDCLDAWSSGTIFSLELEDNLRFGAVPIFTTYPTGPGSYLIDHFSPVWIETVYQNCNANRCGTVFSPGETGGNGACPPDLAAAPSINCGHKDGSPKDDVEGVTAFQLSLGMLDPETQAFFPGDKSVRTLFLLR